MKYVTLPLILLLIITSIFSICLSQQQGHKNYALGDRGPAGGYVFYDTGDYGEGWRYLEVGSKEHEISHVSWDEGIALFPVFQRTNDIEHALHSDFAGAQEEYNWYIPSADELNIVFENLHMHDLGDLCGGYWSSTEYDTHSAYMQAFVGYVYRSYVMNKEMKYHIRPIHRF